MRKRVEDRLSYINSKEHQTLRVQEPYDVTELLKDASPMLETTKLFTLGCDREEALLIGDDIFGFNRYHACLPIDKHQDKIKGAIRFSGNMIIDYATFLKGGINGYRERIQQVYSQKDESAKELYDCMYLCLDSCEKIIEKYKKLAKEKGIAPLFEALERVPMNGATNYYEALICIRFLSYILRIADIHHITLGRFDVYMKPYYDMSIAQGLSKEDILELTELFFISMNIDTDLYDGVQKGDNGQSMVLGGIDVNHKNVFSDLSEICLLASEELKVIDPKINLRVDKNTNLALYERGTRLTKQGLGFPQYTNDDVVIPFMMKLGYDFVDAVDYGVAACWEVITSGVASDLPNAETMNFPLVLERTTNKFLLSSQTFEQFLAHFKDEMILEINKLVAHRNSVKYMPEPLMSLFINPCIERGLDHFYGGAKYANDGIHGAGISTTADALAAIKLKIYDEGSVSKESLLEALNNDFEGFEALQKELINCPKMGNNDDYVDNIASFIMDTFAKNLNNVKNSRGGVYRAGTGSAMEYILSAAEVGATADGRKKGQPYSSSFSPSINVKTNGPLSAVQSFTKYDLTNIANGGPFTIELHNTIFRNDEGLKKVAMLVKTFIDLGGHQIQLNAVNRDTLVDAQLHPEKYPNLIVRVWGWSGYFIELDAKYQNHIISRLEYKV